MANRDRASEIQEIRQRNSRSQGHLSYHLQDLQVQWTKVSQRPGSLSDFYLIRAVTILEVSTRQELALLINHSRQFTDRAVEFSKSFKMDFATVRDVQGRVVTLGDVIAHSVPVNSFGQILDHFGILLGRSIRPLLSGVIDRWQVEIEGRESRPIIEDFEKLAANLTRLFEIRHILCHELPEKSVYPVAEVSGFLESAIQFSKAMEWVLTFEKFGLVPLTQTDMNISQGERLRNAEKDLEHVFGKIRKKIFDLDRSASLSNSDQSGWASSFDAVQETWLAYRNAQCDFVTYLNQGGTIRPLLWGVEAVALTEARITQIQTWFESESKRLAFEEDGLKN
jgi:uncharacterized protein YecT (DUF1311 family)